MSGSTEDLTRHSFETLKRMAIHLIFFEGYEKGDLLRYFNERLIGDKKNDMQKYVVEYFRKVIGGNKATRRQRLGYIGVKRDKFFKDCSKSHLKPWVKEKI